MNTVAAPEAVGVAVIGAGYWGPNLVRNFTSNTNAHLRWVCDLSPDRYSAAVRGRSNIRTTTDLNEVLDDPRVHAIAIATPASTHETIGLAALGSGRHVLIEKPLASSVDGGRKLVEAAQQAGLVLMCGHTYCYTPAVRYLRRMIDKGDFGEIQYVDSVRINLGLVQPDVDVIWDLAPHDLSIIDFILPSDCRPISVSATGADPLGTGRASIAHLSMALPGGAIAHIHVNWLSPAKVRTMILGGSRRMAVWDDLSPTARLRVYDKGVEVASELDRDERVRQLISYRTGDMVAPALAEREALASEVQEFLEAIQDGRDAATDGRSGLRVLEILEAASASLAEGGVAHKISS